MVERFEARVPLQDGRGYRRKHIRVVNWAALASRRRQWMSMSAAEEVRSSGVGLEVVQGSGEA